jgi:hypothetical protein
MWACPRCEDLLIQLGDSFEDAEVDPLDDTPVRVQVVLSGHLRDEHGSEVPGAHEDCAKCRYYERRGDARMWAEHRARDLFLPPSLARLM